LRDEEEKKRELREKEEGRGRYCCFTLTDEDRRTDEQTDKVSI